MTDPFIEEIKKRVEAFNALAIESEPDKDGFMQCPLCEGEGDVEASGYCSPTKAAGVEAYGIGESLLSAEKFLDNAAIDIQKLLALVELYESALNQYATAEFAECHNRYRNLFGEEECESWNQNLAKNALLEGEKIKRGENE